MTNVPNPERYYTRTAWVMNSLPHASTCTEITVGLVGLHIVQKTPSRPQWIWSTFEQIDNVPGGASQGPFTYNNGTAQPTPITANTTNPNPWPPPASPTMVNVVRLTPINQSTATTNKQYQSALQAKGGPWQYYQLVMTQWPKQASQPTQPGTPPFTFPGSGPPRLPRLLPMSHWRPSTRRPSSRVAWPAIPTRKRRRTSSGRFISMPGQVSSHRHRLRPCSPEGPHPTPTRR